MKSQLALLPRDKGVYLLRDAGDQVLYVGKAVNLRNRVRSYFQASRYHPPKIQKLAGQVVRIEVIVTHTESEALLLENTLIKKHWPPFNVLLKDGREFPYLKITWQETYPRLLIARKRRADGAKYYGPFPNSGAVYRLIEMAERVFKVKHCQRRPGERPCLDHSLGRCLAPCVGLADAQEYRSQIRSILLFLEGRSAELLEQLGTTARQLEVEMYEAAARETFERAAWLRDRSALIRGQIDSIEQLHAKQKVVAAPSVEQDILGHARGEDWICLELFQVRSGKLLNRLSFGYSITPEDDLAEVVAAFLTDYYSTVEQPPREVVLPVLPPDRDLVEPWLSGKRGSRVQLVQPVRGKKQELLAMVNRNAELALEQHRVEARRETDAAAADAARDLARVLDLPGPLHRIECFDIAHIQGSDTVASMVVFVHGLPAKSEYRKFKIRQVEGPDDFASMREALTRRYLRVVAQCTAPPDLVMVDGGKGQLGVAVEVLRAVGLPEVAAIGLAKEREEIFVPGKQAALLVPRRHAALRLLQRIRDEAHRFANAFHRQIRSKRMVKSILHDVPGLGERRRHLLIQKLGSVERMRRLSREELQKQSGLPGKVVDALYQQFHPLEFAAPADRESHVS